MQIWKLTIRTKNLKFAFVEKRSMHSFRLWGSHCIPWKEILFFTKELIFTVNILRHLSIIKVFAKVIVEFVKKIQFFIVCFYRRLKKNHQFRPRKIDSEKSVTSARLKNSSAFRHFIWCFPRLVILFWLHTKGNLGYINCKARPFFELAAGFSVS